MGNNNIHIGKKSGIGAGIFLILLGLFTFFRQAHNILLGLACIVAGAGMIIAFANMPQEPKKKE